MSEYKIAFEKYLTYKDKNIFKLIKTKTNRYMLIDCKTHDIVANTKNEILKQIKKYRRRAYKGGIGI